MGDNRLQPLALSEAERRTLQGWATRRKSAQGLALRARIVLACAEGHSNIAVAARVGVSRGTVTKWRARFLARRLDGLGDEPRPGVPRSITDAQVEEVVVRTLEETPEGATHWSKRELARRAGISPTSVHRIWRAFGLQPWRVEDFKISPDPLLIDKVRDVVGCTWRRRTARRSSRSMRSRRSRRWSGPRRCCRCCPGCPSGAATITSGTAPSTCSPR